jgi:hypothetical protein
MYLRMILVADVILTLTFCASSQGGNPVNLHSLSDLRIARSMVDKRPGGWGRAMDQIEAVHQVDAAIYEIEKSAHHDGRSITQNIAMDAELDHAGKIREALEFIHKTYVDVNPEEVGYFAKEMRDRANGHMQAAIQATCSTLNEWSA